MSKETFVAILPDIKRLVEINCYRGMRHHGDPVRGQRKTNARTRKGPKTINNRNKKDTDEIALQYNCISS